MSRALPEHTARALFTRAGRLAYRLAPGVRAIVAANQAQVLGRAPDDPLVLASTREAFALYARFWVDAFHLTELTDDEVLARVSCDTAYRLWKRTEEGKGAVLALPHMGNWDAAGRWMTALGLPLVSVAEELEPRRLYELFLEHRRSIGIDIIGLSDANVGRRLGSALAENRMVALVADRDFGGRGIEVEMFGRTRRLPAGPALLSLMSGAPLMVTPTYQTPDGWRIHISEPLSIEPTGDRRPTSRRSRPDGPGVRGGDRGRAGGLAHVPARLGTVKVALACPYAWDDPGGVQVHIRELSRHLREDGHQVLVLTPARRAPDEPWVRAVGRPVDLRYNDSNAPIDPRPWSFRRVRDALRGFGPDVVHVHEPFAPSTSMWATLAAPTRRWWRRSIRAPIARGSTTSRPRYFAASRAVSPFGSPCLGRRSGSPCHASAGRSRSCRTARMSLGSKTPSRPTSARG